MSTPIEPKVSLPLAKPRRRRSRGNLPLIVGGVLVALIVIMGLLSIFWTPYPPNTTSVCAKYELFSAKHPLGCDILGRDVLSRLMAGARTTLLVGIVAVGIAAIIGVPLGIWAAMSRRWVSETVMRANDLLLAFPALLLAIMLVAVFGSSIVIAMIAIGIASIPSFARVARAGTLQVLQTDFIMAARAAGQSTFAIARKHVLPNIASIVIVQCSIAFAIAILAEAALSYLGLGAPPDTPSWGIMLLQSQDVLYKALRLGVVPGAAIALAVIGFNLLGDGLRDKLDVTLSDAR